MTRSIRLLAPLAAVALIVAACNGEPDVEYSVDQQPDDASASFTSPSDGDTVTADDGEITVEFEVANVTLEPAGIPEVGEGHLHVMIDRGCFAAGDTIPGPSDAAEDDGIFHLGDGSSSRTIPLEPGTYELCVQLGDGIHAAFGQSETITVTVE